MIDRETVFEIYRLHYLGFSIKKISETIRLDWKTVAKYLDNPHPGKIRAERKSKLDPFKDKISELLEIDPKVSAMVIKQKIEELGYNGGITILKDHLRTVRKFRKEKDAFIRFESMPGKQMQIDWGHFGSLGYEKAQRKLYCLSVIECYSRMLFIEFVHSQNQSTLHQALFNSFKFFNGTPEELVVDNMLTAVTERKGKLVRFNDKFLDFLRPLRITPYACNVRAPHEKGKVENSIKYVRYNFWPLRKFSDIGDVRLQSRHWLDNVANVRKHQTTNERPVDRFAKFKLTPLPECTQDFRETCTLRVYKDFAVRFDCNTYTAPPWLVGKYVNLKADHATVTLYHQDKKVANHARSYERKKRVELPSHKEQVKKLQSRLWLDQDISAWSSLGSEAVEYLNALVKAKQPVKRNVERMLKLKDEYGVESIIFAVRKAIKYKAYGADYIENILNQEMTPIRYHPPVKLKDDALNRIRLDQPSLAEYDTYILKKGKTNA
ncbi:IS21 family transposase [Desulfobacterales bacterium HSG16]|nr:IS21 family transposase [Desulfobacterales bacterium HSG16]